jgi:hypothetical protein
VPPCARCGRELRFATMVNSFGDRPTTYVYQCPQCERVAAYYLEGDELRRW